MGTYRPEKLDQIVRGMKALGEVLVPFNFPLAPLTTEDDLGLFKAREAMVDGYKLYIHYQKSDYSIYFIETLQIHNTASPFLPFGLICKLGKRFLGNSHLSLVEMFRDNRKIYLWSLCTDKQGNSLALPNNPQVEKCVYEGFHYSYLQPNQVDFF